MPTRRRRRDWQVWVVKLGGSLARSPLLNEWLDVLAAAGGQVIIVPGGGPFADDVRQMQKRWQFDDRAAHHLALRAMEQYGLMLAGLRPALQPADSVGRIKALLRAGGVPVWMPAKMARGRRDIPESWDVTSDSLAAWLAGRLRAGCLILVKAVPVAAGSTADDLVRLDVVDRAFPGFLAGSRSALRCIDASRHADMARALATGAPPGTPVAAGGSIASERGHANIRR